MLNCRISLTVVTFIIFWGVSCSPESEKSGAGDEGTPDCGGRPCNVVQMGSLLSPDRKSHRFTIYSRSPNEYTQLFDSLGVRKSERHWSDVKLNYGRCRLNIRMEVKSVEDEGWSFVNINPSCVSNGVESDNILDTEEELEKLEQALQRKVCESIECPSSVGNESDG